jgi:3-phenylpropionate/trans-cinnamate dioxygenase ferredoxin reductase component
MASDATYVIIGASLTGAKAAEALRAEGFGGRVIMVGEESERPYERPPLSKAVLLRAKPPEVAYVHEPGWYDDNGVELRLDTRATALDRLRHEVTLGDGERLAYTKLLLATGARARRLSLPGNDLDGVCYLRTIRESIRLRDTLAEGMQVVVIGTGWIGLETAAAARSRGADVTLVGPAMHPLYAVLGPKVGDLFAQLHRDRGVDLKLGSAVREFRGSAGRVSTVVTERGDELPADLVIVGVGIQPNTELAEAAGLDVVNGVVVDARLRTSDPDIFAAGDVADGFNPLLGVRVRVEHWANALNGGPAAARSMLGQEVVYDRVPYFFTDQYDLGMEYSGWSPPGTYDEVRFRGEVGKGEFIAFWLKEGRVRAGMNVNVWDVTEPIQALIRSGRPVNQAKLADPDTPLEEVVTQRLG